MKRKIKISYYTYDHDGQDVFTTIKDIDTEKGLREIALIVISEAIGKTKHNWLTTVNKDQAIIFFLNNSGREMHQGFGIKYGINQDGTLKFLTGYHPLSYNWTLSELSELHNNDYIKGDIDHITLATPEGLGAGLDTVPQILESLTYIGGIYGGLQALKGPTLVIRRRLTALKWRKNGLKSLGQIRELLDEKSVWKTDEVKRRLAVNEELARNTLTKLGYELKNDTWKLAQSSKSLSLRNQWLVKEQEVEKAYQKRLEESIAEIQG